MKARPYTIIFLFTFGVLAFLSGVFFISGDRKQHEKSNQEILTIYSSHPNEFMRPLLEEFEAQTQIHIKIVTGGSGELLERLEEEKEMPQADILWGGSVTTLMSQNYLFSEYQSKNESYVLEEFKNKEGMLTRFSDLPNILIVNQNILGTIKIEDYEDLLNQKLKGKIAYCSPTLSSSAFEHLINMLYVAGEGEPEAGWEYIRKFCRNLDGNLLKSSKEVYQGVEDGEYVVGLTFEEAAASMIAEGKNIGIVYMKGGVISSPDCVCIVKNCTNIENAKKFVDFTTSYGAQNLLSNQLHRRPVRTDVSVPEYMANQKDFVVLEVDREEVQQRKQKWIAQFREIFYSKEREYE